MHRWVQLTGAALALALTANAAQAAEEAQPDRVASVAKGRALAARNCGMCHAIGRVGASATPEAPPFRDLNQRLNVEDLGEGLTQGILTGHPAMPEFRFQPHEVVSIVMYLKSIQAKQHALGPDVDAVLNR